MRNKKTIMIGILCALVAIMAVGYAFLAQELNINGRASIDSTWKVEITNITERDIVGDASSKETPSYTATTANFSVGLIQPGDSITYDIEVTNNGTLDAVLESINVSMEDNDAITYTTSGLKKGDKLTKNGGKNTLTVKVEYNPEVTSQPTNTAKDITITLNYIQDLGEDTPITYDTMPYYWSDTCHPNGYYGYTDYVNSGCDGHNDYEGSKVKEYLEGAYISTLGETNLKEIDGYKIRLITTDELNANLGWVNLYNTAKTDNENANVPTWVYRNFGQNQNGVYGYWTMTPDPDNSSYVLDVYNPGTLNSHNVVDDNNGVRPVINLLKSNI